MEWNIILKIIWNRKNGSIKGNIKKSFRRHPSTFFFRISTGIRRPRHVFLWAVPTENYNNQERNIFTFKTFAIGANNRYFSKAQLEVNNSIYYPHLEMTTNEESRLYRALMSYSSAYNDFLIGSLIDRANFRQLFGIIYFHLRNQEEDVNDSLVFFDVQIWDKWRQSNKLHFKRLGSSWKRSWINT